MLNGVATGHLPMGAPPRIEWLIVRRRHKVSSRAMNPGHWPQPGLQRWTARTAARALLDGIEARHHFDHRNPNSSQVRAQGTLAAQPPNWVAHRAGRGVRPLLPPTSCQSALLILISAGSHRSSLAQFAFHLLLGPSLKSGLGHAAQGGDGRKYGLTSHEWFPVRVD